MTISAEEIVTLSASVVALTQLFKWGGVSGKWGPLLVMGLSAIGVYIYALSKVPALSVTDLWSLFATWVTVVTSAAGVYGFTRGSVDTLTQMKSDKDPESGDPGEGE